MRTPTVPAMAMPTMAPVERPEWGCEGIAWPVTEAAAVEEEVEDEGVLVGPPSAGNGSPGLSMYEEFSASCLCISREVVAF